MTVEELLARISSRELTEWICFFGIEGPAGEERADWRAGLIASTIANANRDPKKRKEPFEPTEFMPKWGDGDAETRGHGDTGTGRGQTVEQQAGMARMLQRALGGEIKVGD
jgi:hypothetical protein